MPLSVKKIQILTTWENKPKESVGPCIVSGYMESGFSLSLKTHTQAHTCTHTRTQMHTHTHMYMHTHTHLWEPPGMVLVITQSEGVVTSAQLIQRNWNTKTTEWLCRTTDSEEIILYCYEEQQKMILSDVSNLFVLPNPPQTLLASMLSLWQKGCAIPMHPEVLVRKLPCLSIPVLSCECASLA